MITSLCVHVIMTVCDMIMTQRDNVSHMSRYVRIVTRVTGGARVIAVARGAGGESVTTGARGCHCGTCGWCDDAGNRTFRGKANISGTWPGRIGHFGQTWQTWQIGQMP